MRGQRKLVNLPPEIEAKHRREREKYVLKPQLKNYMSDFMLMNSSRQMGMNGPQPIPLTDMHNMFFTSDVFRGTSYRKYLRFITSLDAVYLSNHYENNK